MIKRILLTLRDDWHWILILPGHHRKILPIREIQKLC